MQLVAFSNSCYTKMIATKRRETKMLAHCGRVGVTRLERSFGQIKLPVNRTERGSAGSTPIRVLLLDILPGATALGSVWVT